ncbi:GIY-YIG nuclease family protein [Candidatus Aerophobetes bacterium]|nr:GIY-YIG nuclease family protein [Candidatus Aerophobetes bacterium]
MIYKVDGIPFRYVCEIHPDLDKNGKPKEYMPQSRYKNNLNIPLHNYGYGTFCRFKIARGYSRKAGVYLILADKTPKYVGKCESLESRFNMGYGNISPRNCYKGGQPTNCRINKLILQAYKMGVRVTLLFYETKDSSRLEDYLIHELQPEWNKTTEKLPFEGKNHPIIKEDIYSTTGTRRTNMGKYSKLEQYLRESNRDVEILDFNEIEKILGFTLPNSAYTYRAWWANDRTHTHANAWLNAGWKVDSVILGQSVTFRKKVS